MIELPGQRWNGPPGHMGHPPWGPEVRTPLLPSLLFLSPTVLSGFGLGAWMINAYPKLERFAVCPEEIKKSTSQEQVLFYACMDLINTCCFLGRYFLPGLEKVMLMHNISVFPVIKRGMELPTVVRITRG